MYQQRYWKELYQLKVHLNYIELYMEDSEFKDKAVGVFLALTSSTSIAGWVIWQEAAIVWAVIIASSQVVSAVRVFLPYKSRLKALSGLVHEIEELVLYAERKWFDVSEGRLTEEEIHELQYELRAKKTKALKKNLGSNILPEKPKLIEKAQSSANIYFDNFYPVEA